MSRWTAPLSALAGLSRGARRDIARIEDRTPVPLARSVGRDSLFSAGGTASAGFLTYLNAFGEDPVIHPIVSRLAGDTAAARWGLWTKSSTGKPEDRRAVRSHAVLDLLAKPNEFQTLPEVMEAAQQHFDLVGEFDIILGMVGGVALPVDMWVLRPDRIQPRPDAENFLLGWVYTSPEGGERIPIGNEEILRARQPSPVDPYRGMGAIQALMRDLNAQRYTKEWQASFFRNSARPGGIIQIDRHLSDAEWDEFNERWAESHKGVSKAHRVALLEHGATWVDASMTLRDMQMAELEAVTRDKALVAFGMPKSALGIVEDVNRANAEAGEYLYQQHMIKPRLERWRAMFNAQLLPKYGPRTATQYELDFEDPVPANGEAEIAALTAKSTALVALVAAGADPAKVLDMLDWPDLGIEKRDLEAEAEAKNAALAAGREADQKAGAGKDKPRESATAAGPAARAAALPVTWSDPHVDMAMRWKVVGHPDTSCCDPCMKNLGKLYRNRESAWSDYPNGRAYIKCVGERYGNHCRCRVIKRRDGR